MNDYFKKDELGLEDLKFLKESLETAAPKAGSRVPKSDSVYIEEGSSNINLIIIEALESVIGTVQENNDLLKKLVKLNGGECEESDSGDDQSKLLDEGSIESANETDVK